MTTPPASGSHPPARPGRADDGRDRVRGRLMQQSLAALLDRVRGAREVLPHLAALEQALGQQGSRAIEKVPPHWLAKICSQLSSLPLPEDDVPLQDLQTRLLAALRGQRSEQEASDAERTVVIREISHSEFDAAIQGQVTTPRPDEP
ncbi:MAG: hypothetical protein KGI90_12380 [Burkholderiales bacterium]|nr:hypothetical protein [Burkholderiales bacterium]MDE2277588.1 hypothetical protein [Burkholderiales bacterium]